jgi:hypothetical protein
MVVETSRLHSQPCLGLACDPEPESLFKLVRIAVLNASLNLSPCLVDPPDCIFPVAALTVCGHLQISFRFAQMPGCPTHRALAMCGFRARSRA